MICQDTFNNSNECAALLEDVDNGGGCACLGPWGHMQTLYPLLNFSVNLKLLKKYILKENNILNCMVKRMNVSIDLFCMSPPPTSGARGSSSFNQDHSPTWPSLASFHTFSTSKLE